MPRPNTPPSACTHNAPRRRASIRRRLLAAFVFLALLMSAALGIVGRLSFDSLGTYLVGWHARPVMDAFTAIPAVSPSRISPIIIMSGS